MLRQCASTSSSNRFAALAALQVGPRVCRQLVDWVPVAVIWAVMRTTDQAQPFHSRDLGTAFRLLESVVLKAIEPQRVIVAINQADLAMKGHHWNAHLSHPEPTLRDFLEEQAHSIQRRIRELTGLSINRPVYYSAKFGYNVTAMFDHIIRHLPSSRLPRTRLDHFCCDLDTPEKMWQ